MLEVTLFVKASYYLVTSLSCVQWTSDMKMCTQSAVFYYIRINAGL
jgi:hypothetical protein